MFSFLMKCIISVWMIFLSLNSWAQPFEIRGKLLNGDNGEPLQAASVFINNSSKGTLTGKDGTFILSEIYLSNFELIVSYTGFKTAVIAITQNNIGTFQNIKLFPRVETMEAITILTPEVDGWKKWGQFFKENFLGLSENAGQSKILNPKAIKFFHDRKNSQVTAYSDERLEIVNNALGYKISYQLEDFTYNFKTTMIGFEGYILFSELKGNARQKRKWESARSNVYHGSVMQFIRSIFKDSVAQYGFIVNEQIRIDKNDSLFFKLYSPGQKLPPVMIDGEEFDVWAPAIPVFKKIPDYLDLIKKKPLDIKDIIKKNGSDNSLDLIFDNLIRVIYSPAFNGKTRLLSFPSRPNMFLQPVSTATLPLGEPLDIYKDGSYGNPLNWITSGYWGWMRMAEMLPTDYKPVKEILNTK